MLQNTLSQSSYPYKPYKIYKIYKTYKPNWAAALFSEIESQNKFHVAQIGYVSFSQIELQTSPLSVLAGKWLLSEWAIGEDNLYHFGVGVDAVDEVQVA